MHDPIHGDSAYQGFFHLDPSIDYIVEKLVQTFASPIDETKVEETMVCTTAMNDFIHISVSIHDLEIWISLFSAHQQAFFMQETHRIFVSEGYSG